MNVSKKIVLVTGASRGIGMAIASELAINGAIVMERPHHQRELQTFQRPLLRIKMKVKEWS